MRKCVNLFRVFFEFRTLSSFQLIAIFAFTYLCVIDFAFLLRQLSCFCDSFS